MNEFKHGATAQDVADEFSCSVATVYRMARAGEIPAVRMGRGWRFNLEEVKQARTVRPASWAQPRRSLARRRVA